MRKGEKEMCRRISTKGLEREEWLRLRKQGIGGSDAGAIAGLNPCCSPMKVYLDKISPEFDGQDSEAMRVGRDLEEYTAMRFTEATGLKVRRSNYMYQSMSHPFMIADVDRLIVGEDAGLECKTCSAFHADQWKDRNVPVHYLIQVLHYMAVTGRKAWYIAVLILGVGFQYVKIERDEEMIRDLVGIESEFWNGHVIPRVMPSPDGSDSCSKVLGKIFERAKKGEAIPLVGFDGKLERREELERMIDEMETEKKKIDQELKLFLGDHEAAFNERYRVTWSNVDSARLDTGKLKEEQPEVYKHYEKISTYRRLQVRAA